MIALAWLSAHRRLAAELAALAIAFAGGWWASPSPAPAIAEKLDTHAASDARSAVDTKKTEGPKAVIRYILRPGATVYLPGPPGSPLPGPPPTADVAEVDVESDGPVVTESHATAEQHAATDTHLALTIAPTVRPGWELQLGIEDVLAAREVRLAARRRLFGDLWVEVSAKPAQRQIGVAAAWAF